MAGQRMRRVNEAIREVLSEAITEGLKDPRIGFVTIVAVEVTTDLHLAKIFFTVIGDDASKKNSEAGIRSRQ